MNKDNKYKELGVFYTEKDKNEKFSGILHYGQYENIKLKILNANTKNINGNIFSGSIYGILESGKACTLLFPTNISSKINIYNGVLANSIEIEYELLILGDFYKEIDNIKRIEIYPKNFYYFFDLNDSDWRAELHDKDIFEIDFRELTIKIDKKLSLSKISNINKRIKKLNKKLEDYDISRNVSHNQDNELLFFVKDSNTYITITFKKYFNIKKIINYLSIFSGFFSLILNKPVIINNFSIYKNDENKIHVEIYTRPFSDKRIIKNMKRKRHKYVIPINISNIDFNKVYKKWVKVHNNYRILIDIINYDNRIINTTKLYGELVILITILEDIGIKLIRKFKLSINKKYYKKIKKKKYDIAIRKISPIEFINYIEYLMKKSNYDDIGKFISNLRAEIVHTKKQKKILNILNIYELGRMHYILRLSIQGYVLKEIGIHDDLIFKYIKYYFPYKLK